MSTNVQLRYDVDVTGSVDDFAPERIIGQSNDDIRRWVRNGTQLWSRHNRRRLLVWCAGPQITTAVDPDGGLAVTSVSLILAYSTLANMAQGRSRLQFASDAINADVTLAIIDRDLLTVIGVVTNLHAGVRSILTTNFASATLLTTPAIFLAVNVQQNLAPGTVFSFRVIERQILSSDL